MYDAASTILAQKLSQVNGVGQVTVGGSSLPAVRVELNPPALNKYGIGFEDVRTAIAATNVEPPEGLRRGRRPALADLRQRPGEDGRRVPAADRRLPQRRGGAPARRRRGRRLGAGPAQRRARPTASPSVLLIINRQPNANIIETVDRVHGAAAAAARVDPERDRPRRRDRPHRRRSARRCATSSARWSISVGARDPGRVPVPAQLARDADSRASRCRSR